MESKDKKNTQEDKLENKSQKTTPILNAIIIFLLLIIIAALSYSLFISKNKSAVKTEVTITPFVTQIKDEESEKENEDTISVSPITTPSLTLTPTISPTTDVSPKPTLKIIPPYKFLKTSSTPSPTP